MTFEHAIISNDNGGNDGGFGEEMEESINKVPGNLKENLGARLLNARSLEGGDVGMTLVLMGH